MDVGSFDNPGCLESASSDGTSWHIRHHTQAVGSTTHRISDRYHRWQPASKGRHRIPATNSLGASSGGHSEIARRRMDTSRSGSSFQARVYPFDGPGAAGPTLTSCITGPRRPRGNSGRRPPIVSLPMTDWTEPWQPRVQVPKVPDLQLGTVGTPASSRSAPFLAPRFDSLVPDRRSAPSLNRRYPASAQSPWPAESPAYGY